MSLTLIVAILFTVAVPLSLVRRTASYWWLAPLIFTVGALINWLRYFDIIQ